MDEPLIHKTPQGEFEIFIWERHMNKCLSKEIKVQKEANTKLLLENDHLQTKMKKLKLSLQETQVGQLIAKNSRLKEQNGNLNAKNKKLEKKNSDLINRLAYR